MMTISVNSAAGAKGNEANFITDSSGNVTGLEAPDGSRESVLIQDIGQGAIPPRILKRFLDLANVTVAASTATVSASIDRNSPFGGPALKLIITPSGSGARCDVTLTDINIPAFDDHIAASVWLPDACRMSTIEVWQSEQSGFTNYSSWKTTVFSGGDVVGGHRVYWGGPMHQGTKTNGGTGFVAGETTLGTVRLRLNAINNTAAFTIWIKDIFIPARQRPVVCFTWDDGYETWISRVLPHLTATGVKATFGIQSSLIDSSALYPTSADVQTIAAAGHQIAAHNVNNYRLQTLLGHGNGEQNGTSTSNPSDTYATEYATARKALEALGVDPEDFCYHPWVQGGVDNQAMNLLRANGVEIARTTSIYHPQPYGFPMGNNVMDLNAWPLGSAKTLAQNKAAVDQAVKYGGLLIFMGHQTEDIATDSVTAAENDVAALLAYVVEQDCDIMTMRGLRDRLRRFRALPELTTDPYYEVRMIGRLSDANMNSTADQAITLPAGSWEIVGIYAAKASISLTTAVGGVYTAASKGGTAVVANTQVYTALTGATTDVQICTVAANPTVTLASAGTGLYLSLTTAQGATATADIFVFARSA